MFEPSDLMAGPTKSGPAMLVEKTSAWLIPVFASTAALNSSAVTTPAYRARPVAVAEPVWSIPSPSRAVAPPHEPDQVSVALSYLACQMP